MQPHPDRWIYLDRLTNICLVILLPLVAWKIVWGQTGAAGQGRSIPVPDSPIVVEQRNLEGSMVAPVGMIVFSDFECPFCRNFATQMLPALSAAYIDKGQLLVAFRQLPLPGHRFATEFAVATECAAEQAKFWGMHDQLFAAPAATDAGAVEEMARSNLDLRAFRECTAATPARERVNVDLALARSLGLTGTPGFVVGALDHESGELSLRATAVIPGLPRQQQMVRSIEDAMDAARSSRD